MSLVLILALQAGAAAAPAPAPPAGIDFDLADYRPAGSAFSIVNRSCRGNEAVAIIVCGRRPSGGAYPLAEMERIYGPPPPLRAEIGLGGGAVARAYVQQVELDRGAVSNRVMIGISWPF